MPKILKKKTSRSKAAMRETNVRAEVAAVVVETRHLLKQIETLAHAVGGALPDAEETQHIPERGRVRIIGSFDDAEELTGREGIALAGGPDAEGQWNYTVLIDALDETYLLPEFALNFLGWTVPAETMYAEPIFSVQADQKGYGTLVRKTKKGGN